MMFNLNQRFFSIFNGLTSNGFFVLLFTFFYPLLYVPSINPQLSWSVPRLVFIGTLSLFGFVQMRTLSWKMQLLPWLFILHALLSIGSSFNPLEDEWIYTVLGNDDRLDGLLYQIALAGFSLLVIQATQKDQMFKKFFPWVLLSSGVIHSLVILSQQMATVIPLGFFQFSFLFDTPLGFTGRSGYTAGLLMPTVILGVGIIFSVRPPWNFLAFCLTCFVALGLSCNQNRAAILALIIAFLIWVIFYRTVNRFLVLILLSLTAFFGYIFVPNLLEFGRKADEQTLTVETRLEIWKIAIRLLPTVSGFPFIGGGSSAFQLAISEFLPPLTLINYYQKEYGWPSTSSIKKIELTTTKATPRRNKTYLIIYNGKDISFQLARMSLDRAHNFILDKIFQFGVLDAGLWVIFYTAPVIWFFRRKLLHTDLLDQSLMICLLGIIIYYVGWFSVMQVEPIHVIIGIIAWARFQYAPSRRNTLEIVRAIR